MKKIVSLLFSIALCYPTKAIVRPASLFNDGMVLQQQSDVRFWGRAKANTRVTVKGSWNNRTVSCKSDADGKWEVLLPTPKASYDNYTVTISDGSKLKIKNVKIGEVWFVSGQSNMEMMVYGFINCPTENSAKYIAQSGQYRDKIRMVSIPRFPLRQPGDFVDATWKECKPEVVRNFSAVGYFFATQLVDKLGCPVGIINNAWGGTRVEGWTPRQLLESYGEDLSTKTFQSRATSWTPMVMYNGMVKPLSGYNIRGFLWYQGEANVWWQPENYAERFSNMIRQWRSDWKLGDLPFLFVEIAPYNYNKGLSAPMVREAQCEVQHRVNNAYMVCTNDLVKPYESTQIHPCMKFEVAERLSMLAFSKVYGMSGIEAQSPEYQKMEVKDGKALLSFSHVGAGFNRFEDIQGFEIAGTDKKFVPAHAAVNGRRIEVSSPLVKEPAAVRYCFKDWQLGNLASGDNLPVIPFRTDK